MNYREALAWLYGTQLFGIKLGLENIQRLLGALQLPAPAQRILHVAGTNGKGSVCAMLDSILRAQNYRTGLFTSPHLVTFRERLQVNGEMIALDEVAAGLTSIRDLAAEWDPHPTFFEIITALALQHFRSAECEYVVLETGLGGRLDATNAVTPIVSAITPIALDHQKWLGYTLTEIAGEKSGIIKPGVPVVSAAQSAVVERVLRERAEECATTIQFVDAPYVSGPVGLAGDHQKDNAALAIAALEAAKVPVTSEAIRHGLTNVSWPARFQEWNEQIVLDGAHNPAGAMTLATAWRQRFGDERAAVVFGVFEDKEIHEIVAAIRDIVHEMHLPSFHGGRVAPPQHVAAIVNQMLPDCPVAIHSTVADAIAAAQTRGQRVLIAGSLHLAGEALAFLRGEPAAFEECDQ